MPGGPCRAAPLVVLIASRAAAVARFLQRFSDAFPLAPFLWGQAEASADFPHATLVARTEGDWDILAGGPPEGLGVAHRYFLS